VAETRTVEGRAPLRELAARLRTPLGEPGSIFSALRPEAHHHLCIEAKRLATVFQRYDTCVYQEACVEMHRKVAYILPYR
jgi:hypothetical protein